MKKIIFISGFLCSFLGNVTFSSWVFAEKDFVTQPLVRGVEFKEIQNAEKSVIAQSSFNTIDQLSNCRIDPITQQIMCDAISDEQDRFENPKKTEEKNPERQEGQSLKSSSLEPLSPLTILKSEGGPKLICYQGEKGELECLGGDLGKESLLKSQEGEEFLCHFENGKTHCLRRQKSDNETTAEKTMEIDNLGFQGAGQQKITPPAAPGSGLSSPSMNSTTPAPRVAPTPNPRASKNPKPSAPKLVPASQPAVETGGVSISLSPQENQASATPSGAKGQKPRQHTFSVGKHIVLTKEPSGANQWIFTRNPTEDTTVANFWRNITGRDPHESGKIHLKVSPDFPEDQIEKTSQRVAKAFFNRFKERGDIIEKTHTFFTGLPNNVLEDAQIYLVTPDEGIIRYQTHNQDNPDQKSNIFTRIEIKNKRGKVSKLKLKTHIPNVQAAGNLFPSVADDIEEFFASGAQENVSGPKEHPVIKLKSGYNPVQRLLKGYDPEKLLLKNLRADANKELLKFQKEVKFVKIVDLPDSQNNEKIAYIYFLSSSDDPNRTNLITRFNYLSPQKIQLKDHFFVGEADAANFEEIIANDDPKQAFDALVRAREAQAHSEVTNASDAGEPAAKESAPDRPEEEDSSGDESESSEGGGAHGELEWEDFEPVNQTDNTDSPQDQTSSDSESDEEVFLDSLQLSGSISENNSGKLNKKEEISEDQIGLDEENSQNLMDKAKPNPKNYLLTFDLPDFEDAGEFSQDNTSQNSQIRTGEKAGGAITEPSSSDRESSLEAGASVSAGDPATGEAAASPIDGGGDTATSGANDGGAIDGVSQGSPAVDTAPQATVQAAP